MVRSLARSSRRARGGSKQESGSGVADLAGTDGLSRSRRGLRQARASKFSLKGPRFSFLLVIANSSAKVKLLDP
jgi:hypothetical protein